MITAGHNFDLGRVLVGIDDDDDNRDDIISELIKIASEEWINGNLSTRRILLVNSLDSTILKRVWANCFLLRRTQT